MAHYYGHNYDHQPENEDYNDEPWFVDGEGIERNVIQTDLPRYLGNGATLRPGKGPDGRMGYRYSAYRPLTDKMIESLKTDSARFVDEKKRQRYQHLPEPEYHQSQTLRDSRRRAGAVAPPVSELEGGASSSRPPPVAATRHEPVTADYAPASHDPPSGQQYYHTPSQEYLRNPPPEDFRAARPEPRYQPVEAQVPRYGTRHEYPSQQQHAAYDYSREQAVVPPPVIPPPPPGYAWDGQSWVYTGHGDLYQRRS